MKSTSTSRTGIILKVFLARCEPEKQRALERFLPQSRLEELEDLPDLLHDPASTQPSDWDILKIVHWSWLIPILKTYSEAEQKLFLSTLDPYDAKNLAKALTLSPNNPPTAPIGQAFLRSVLTKSLLGPEHSVLPPEYLPPSTIQGLLHLSKPQLTHLIDLLAMHDLAVELRQIVETKILKKIYSLLTEEERKFLKTAMTRKDPFPLGRIGIERWDSSEESLRLLLHKKGLARLGAALSGQHPDFIWYICHRLDIGRGSALHKLCGKESIHGVTDALVRQIEELL